MEPPSELHDASDSMPSWIQPPDASHDMESGQPLSARNLATTGSQSGRRKSLHRLSSIVRTPLKPVVRLADTVADTVVDAGQVGVHVLSSRILQRHKNKTEIVQNIEGDNDPHKK